MKIRADADRAVTQYASTTTPTTHHGYIPHTGFTPALHLATGSAKMARLSST